MKRKMEISSAESDWATDDISDEVEEVIDKRDFNTDDIFKKRSADKSVDERIKTSRSLKIKHNKWNQVSVDEDYNDTGKIVIDPQYNAYNSTVEDIEFEKKFHNILISSKYYSILFPENGEKSTISYQTVNDILLYVYARMKREYTLVQVFVMLCEYCGITLSTMWKRVNSYYQKQMLEELTEISKLPKEFLDNNVKLF